MFAAEEVRGYFLRRAAHHEKSAARAIESGLGSFADFHKGLAQNFRQEAEAIEKPAPTPKLPIDRWKTAKSVIFCLLSVAALAFWFWVILTKVHNPS